MILKRWLSRWARYRNRFDRFAQLSYAQEGEDRVLARLFEGVDSGFYVDIGAHHPRRFSNTHLFYQRGWRGINVDATPGSMTRFTTERPRDINLEVAVLKDRRRISYFLFNEPALNTFSKERSIEVAGIAGYQVVSTVEIEGVPLAEVLSENLPPRLRHIDFLTIDVEGLDFEVLQSNDWNRFRPRIILVELVNSMIESGESDPVYRFLRGHKYHLFAKTVQTVFFISDEYRIERGIETRSDPSPHGFPENLT